MNESLLDRHRRTAFDGARWGIDYQRINQSCRAGYDAEDSGDNDSAVEHYAAAITTGEQIGDSMFHSYRHAYERIIALLRRTPDVETLERYCRAYIAHPVDEPTRTRINKIIESI